MLVLDIVELSVIFFSTLNTTTLNSTLDTLVRKFFRFQTFTLCVQFYKETIYYM